MVVFKVIFDDRLDQLVIWCLHKVTKRPRMSQEVDQLFVKIFVKRVADTSITKATGLNMNVVKFVHKVTIKAKEEFVILRERVKAMQEQLYAGPAYRPLGMIEYSFDEMMGLRNDLAQASLDVTRLNNDVDMLKESTPQVEKRVMMDLCAFHSA